MFIELFTIPSLETQRRVCLQQRNLFRSTVSPWSPPCWPTLLSRRTITSPSPLWMTSLPWWMDPHRRPITVSSWLPSYALFVSTHLCSPISTSNYWGLPYIRPMTVLCMLSTSFSLISFAIRPSSRPMAGPRWRTSEHLWNPITWRRTNQKTRTRTPPSLLLSLPSISSLVNSWSATSTS